MEGGVGGGVLLLPLLLRSVSPGADEEIARLGIECLPGLAAAILAGAAAEQIAEDAGVLLMQLRRHLGERVRVLHHPLLHWHVDAHLLAQLLDYLSELPALIGRHVREGLRCRLLKLLRRQLRHDLLELLGDLLRVIPFRWGALLVAVHEVLILLPLLAARLRAVHGH